MDSTYYRSVQTWPNGVGLIYFLWIPVTMFFSGDDWLRAISSLALPIVFLAGVVLTFRRLEVLVTDSSVRLIYGLGWPHKTFKRETIRSATPHRYPWWYFWGIRRTPKGWMWSVWGRDAVLLTLDNRAFLIGTDDAETLATAINTRHGVS